MARPRNRLVDYLLYLGVRVLEMFLHMFDVRAGYRFARLVGEVVWRVDRRHRRIACGHLRLSFPDWSEDRVQRVARESIRSLACLVVEVLWTPRLITPVRWRRHVRLANMSEAVGILTRQESGVILVTGHFGNWEVVGYLMATLGFPTVSVFRPLDNRYINDYLMGFRERTGQSLLYKRGAVGSMTDVIAGQGALAFVADQDAGRKDLFVDFFGRPARTYRSVGLLATTHNVPIIVGYGRRLGENFEFEIGIQRIIRPADWAGKADPILWITQEFTRELETIIRRDPEQYLWVHRRWKHRPDGTRVMGDGVA